MSFLQALNNLIFGKKVSGKTKRLINASLTKSYKCMKSDDITYKKACIIELDSLMGKALKELYGGQTVFDNLKMAKNRFNFNTYQMAWDAHKMRNKVAHEPDYSFTQKELNNSLSNFVNVLKQI